MTGLAFVPSIADRLLRGEYHVLISGASGWLGKASLEMLSNVYGDRFHDRVACFGTAPRALAMRNGLSIDQGSLGSMPCVERHRYILLHFACLANDKVSTMPLADYLARNRAISSLARAAAERVGVERVFLVSSGAVYRALAAPKVAASAHPYGALKLEDEVHFRRFAEDRTGRKVVTARLFNLSGPYINKLGTYALSSFVGQAREGGAGATIRINAGHPVVRSYIGVGNLLNVAFSQLLDDRAEAYDYFDTAGEREVEVQELADIVRAVVNPDAAVIRSPQESAQPDRYVGDGTRFRALAALHGISLDVLNQQVRDTAEYIESL